MLVKKIYFDMDDVLADFSGGVRELCGVEPPKQGGRRKPGCDDEMWERIRDTKHFYDRLRPMPGAKELFDTLYVRYGDACEILTGIPKPHRGILTAGEDKTKWAHRALLEKVVVNVVFREQKREFCTGKDCILIDDLAKNVKAWEENGGTGIVYRSAEETEQILKDMRIL